VLKNVTNSIALKEHSYEIFRDFKRSYVAFLVGVYRLYRDVTNRDIFSCWLAGLGR